jgi:hypothetical protein
MKIDAGCQWRFDLGLSVIDNYLRFFYHQSKY